MRSIDDCSPAHLIGCSSTMSDRPRRHFDIRIEMLSERRMDAAAAVHQICFPEKVESLLGRACIFDTYRERFLNTHPDTFCLLAIHAADDRVAGFVYVSDLVPQSSSPHSFTNKRLLMRHFARRIWFSPRVWMWCWGRFRNRDRQDFSEGRARPIPPDGSVVKMVGVHPDFRGGNVGGELMRAVEVEARRRGARSLHLLVERGNIRAERLYQSVGWVRTDPNANRWQLFAMRKELAS